MFGEKYGNRLLWVEDFIKGGVDTLVIIGCSGAVNIVDRLTKLSKQENPSCKVMAINPNPHEVQGVDDDVRASAVEGLLELRKQKVL